MTKRAGAEKLYPDYIFATLSSWDLTVWLMLNSLVHYNCVGHEALKIAFHSVLLHLFCRMKQSGFPSTNDDDASLDKVPIVLHFS